MAVALHLLIEGPERHLVSLLDQVSKEVSRCNERGDCPDCEPCDS
jgi:hypothetical protein